MVFTPVGSGEVKMVWCFMKKDYTKRTELKKLNTTDIMSSIIKTFEFCCVWGYEKRGRKVVRFVHCDHTSHSWSCSMSLSVATWEAVRGQGSSHWNNFSSAAWDSLVCLYYLCKDSCFSTLFLALQAWNVIKQNLVQNNHSHTSNRARLNFLISFSIKNTREPHLKEMTGNAGSEPTPATLFLCF